MTDMDMNITYQDSQYLAELYSRLGSLQYDLANIDVIHIGDMVTMGLIVGLCGCLIGIWVFIFLMEYDGPAPIIVKPVGMVLYIMLVIAIWYCLSEWIGVLTVHRLENGIEATEMAIRAMETKLGLI